MPSTYTLNNGIELIGTGEQSGTWGDTTNTNLQLLDTALDGQITVTLASAGTSGSPNTLSISDGTTSDGRNRMIIFADGGDLGATAYVQLTPNDAEKIIYIRNNLSGSRSILFFQGTYNASNDYEVPAGTTAVVYFNGGGSGAVAANVFNNAYFDSLRLGSVSVTAILDEDNMASDSATALATQQSIKAYVDSQVGTVDTLSEILANGNTTGGNDILFADNDKAIFGAGSDLQIYHDGANSYIQDTGTGALGLFGSTFVGLYETGSGDKMVIANGGSDVELYYDNALKLATTSTGIDVTGTAVTDGLTVAGNVSVDGGTIKLDGNYPTGTDNVALGNTALDALTSGTQNTAIGSGSLSANTSGTNNTGVGRVTLAVNTTGNNNVALGNASLYYNTTGGSNAALGTSALESNTTASGNTMAGYQAGYLVGDEIVATAIVSGVNYTIQTLGTTDFTLIGAGANTVGTTFTATGAGTGTGTASANANYNTFVGHQAGDLIVGGSKNSILGRFDGNQGGLDIRNSDNHIVLSDGDGNPRLYIDGSGNMAVDTNTLYVDATNNRVGVGNASPDGNLTVGSTTTSGDISIRIKGDATSRGFLMFGDAGGAQLGDIMYDHSDNHMRFRVNNLEAMRIDSSQRVLIGTNSSINGYYVQVAENSGYAGVSALRYTNDAFGAYLNLGKSRTTTIGGNTIVQDNDVVGYITFSPNDGTDLVSISSQIQGEIDGTPGANDVPGRLVFSTTADGASASTERMRIQQNGFVGVGTTAPLSGFHISDGTNAGSPQNPSRAATLMIDAGATASADLQFMVRNGYNSHIFFGDAADPNVGIILYDHSANAMVFNTNASEAMRIDSSQRVTIGDSTLQKTYNSTAYPHFQITPSNSTGYAIGAINAYTTTAGNYAQWIANKSNTNTVGTQALVAVNNGLALFGGQGSDGTEFVEAASIRIDVDGTAAANEMPGRIKFLTTAVGASSGTERMRINNSGDVTIGNAADARARLEVYDDGVSAVYDAGDLSTWRVMQVRNNIESFTGTAAGIAFGGDGSGDTETAGIVGISDNSTGGIMQLAFITATGNNSIERMRITSAGTVGINNTIPDSFYSGANNLVVGSGSGEEGITIYGASTSTSYLLFADGSSGSSLYSGQVRYSHLNDRLEFCTTNNSTARLSVDSDGIKFNGDTAAANALDDYEEGASFTVTDQSGASLSLTVLASGYTKIGQMVHAWYSVTYPTTSNTSPARLSLPFTSALGSSFTGGAVLETSYTGGAIMASIDSSTYVRFRNNGLTPLLNSDLSAKNLRFIIHYIAA